MTYSATVKRQKQLLIGNGALIMLFGCLIGLAFVFFLIGKIALWPIPGEIIYQLPGTYDAWRMAHMEGLVNGIMLMVVAASIHLIPFSEKMLSKISLGLIVIAWANPTASLMDALFENSRGLEMAAPFFNTFAYLLFLPTGLLTLAILAAIGYRTLKGAPIDKLEG
mgnify:CR=1 FL=1